MIIDTLYSGVIAKLTEGGEILSISQKLMGLTTNDERTMCVYEILAKLDAFPALLKVSKSDKVSTHYRNLGNKCFQQIDNYKAWQYYNLSLLHAPLDTDNYCLALGNRSAIFSMLKKYKECINDIEMVLSMNCPINLKNKLLKRKEMCQKVMSKNENKDDKVKEIIDFLNLKGERDSRYICASTKLKVAYNKMMGHHVIAKEDIKVGEVLAQEEPYFKLLSKYQILFSCSHCLSRQANLIPCDSCCFALYCNKDCKQKAWQEYHSVECPLMVSLIKMEFTKLELLALRTVIKARNDHKDWQSLFETIEEAEKMANTEFRGHVKVDDQWIYDSKYYASIHTLASNIDKRSASDIFQKGVTAAVFLKFLVSETDFLKDDNEESNYKILKCVAGMLLLHIMTSPTNMHSLTAVSETSQGLFTDEFNLGSAPYAFHSLLNHSCAPNVVRYKELGSGKMTLFALRPIKKGMQIFDNYGQHHALQPRQSRQSHLKFQYKFICHCEACVDDWPTYFGLKRAFNLPKHILVRKDRILDSKAISQIEKGDICTAVKLFKPLCELLEALEPYAPCLEVADCQESLKQCIAIFEGLVPYGYTNLVAWDAVPPEIK